MGLDHFGICTMETDGPTFHEDCQEYEFCMGKWEDSHGCPYWTAYDDINHLESSIGWLREQYWIQMDLELAIGLLKETY